jgi:serine/threonine protein phosphatase 1
MNDPRPRTLAIGDIHGCLGQFDALLRALELTASDRVVLLGDYIDRGTESAGVLRRIRALAASHRLSAIKGNHEQMMLEARDSHEKRSDWLLNGGDKTLQSYAGSRATLRDVPEEDWRFLTGNLVDYLETDTHIFVHAGAYADMPMGEQPDYMLRWERFDSIAPHRSGKIIVCGHTPQPSGRPANRGYAICLDTFTFGGGPLSCLDTDSGRVWQSLADRTVRRCHISDFNDPS